MHHYRAFKGGPLFFGGSPVIQGGMSQAEMTAMLERPALDMIKSARVGHPTVQGVVGPLRESSRHAIVEGARPLLLEELRWAAQAQHLARSGGLRRARWRVGHRHQGVVRRARSCR